jgi:hypothetical protein
LLLPLTLTGHSRGLSCIDSNSFSINIIGAILR